MKTKLLILLLSCNTFFSIYSQTGIGINSNENFLEFWTEFDPKKKDYRETTKILSGIISENIILTSRETYLLQGIVYVVNNATLTIEPGTVIRGDNLTCGTLVITKGSKIVAEGSENLPIVFTTNKDSYSRKPGDWGGLILLGDAPVNTFGGVGTLNFDLDSKYNRYGGSDKESNSGILKYVRVEYSGRKLSEKKELNGISFAGVGNKTIIQNVQISYSNDDSFEFYGGNVNFEKLISFRATDDDFDFTQGAQVNFKNSIALRNPFSSDAENSRCLEIDSYDSYEKFDSQRSKTNINATNLTFINLEDNTQGLIKESIFLSNDSYLKIANTVVFGFKDFLMVKDATVINESEKYLNVKDVVIAHCDNVFSLENTGLEIVIDATYDFNKNNIETLQGTIFDFFKNPNLKKYPDFRYLRIDNSTSFNLPKN